MGGWGGCMQVAGMAYNVVSAWFAASAEKENYRQQGLTRISGVCTLPPLPPPSNPHRRQ